MAPSKSERAYELLQEKITSGAYSPGYRLVLSSLAAELDCSVVPVREAIRRLEAEGLVTFERNIGATVAHVDATLYLHTMQTLAVLEGAATALAAPLIGADALARARTLNRQMQACLDNFDPQRFTRLNNDFHELLYGACPNPHILDLVHRGWRRMRAMRPTTFTTVPHRARDSVAEHDALLDLLDSGAAASAVESAAREHRTNTLNAYLAAAGLPPSTLTAPITARH
ncbi:GntR family transcriptional regulator [Zhihengliuella halotolerans]|uniref:DNA-binding GntR family transcriptional regulator n=1 Tax=Zhihengliuella halotolerans TaxID=370736 RepID=A0A4Q8ABS5_9MICC|nr:GntR family transcriptional regulator [Zhihengliuella halotolerans]RZU61630.1 DNA-binding GntR family transcriptional regulator [Zhihengliuella halotolerans]